MRRNVAVSLLCSLIAIFGGTAFAPQPAWADAGSSVLRAGESLVAGQSIRSADGRYAAVMQHDGNFVVYGPGGATWHSGSGGTGDGASVTMQGDGNLVVYRSGGSPMWSSSTAPSRGNTLVLQDDGNLVVYSSGGLALWSSYGGRTGNFEDTLGAGSSLLPDQSIRSRSGQYTAVMQRDGNFVLYGPGGATWSSSTSGAGDGVVAVVQGDGNFVLYAPGSRPIYSSSTAPSSGNRLVVQDDGNLVIYDGSGRAVWAKGQALGGGAPGIDAFRSWALNSGNWNSRTPSGNRGIDADGSFGAQCADLGIAWSSRVGRRVGFSGWDNASKSKPGWHAITGNLGSARPGDVVTRVNGTEHVVVVVGSPSGGQIAILQQNPASPHVTNRPVTQSGVIWRMN